MQELVSVAVDAMGGDHAPLEIVKGAVEAVNSQDNLNPLFQSGGGGCHRSD